MDADLVYVSRGHRLIDPHYPDAEIRRYTRTALTTPGVFLLSIVAAQMSVDAARTMWMGLALYSILFPHQLWVA